MPSPGRPEKYDDMAKKAENGSRKAAIRLHCLECVGWQSKEVRLCTAKKCPLYRYRMTG